MLASRGEIKSLTGIRCVAAYGVLIAHALNIVYPNNVDLYWFAHRLAYFSMSLFFVLSGFVIHYNYAALIRSEGGLGVYKFIVARFARLYPLYLFVLIVGGAFAIEQRPHVLLAHLTLSQSWFNMADAIFAPSWSISTEWFFYLVFAVFALLLPASPRPGRALVALLIGAPMLLLLTFLYREQVTSFFFYFGPLLSHGRGSSDSGRG